MRTNLRESEEVFYKTRKHWVVFFKPLGVSLTVIVTLSFLLITQPPEYLKGVIDFFWTITLWFGVPLSIFYWAYSIAERKFNIWVVTNMRVIDEWGVISHNMKESSLDKINNISYKQSFWGLIFDYGDVEIQTAAEQGKTVSHFVTSPKTFHEEIIAAQSKYTQRVAAQTQKRKEVKVPSESSGSINEENRIKCPCGKDIALKTKLSKGDSHAICHSDP